jgi:hypothetical protein
LVQSIPLQYCYRWLRFGRCAARALVCKAANLKKTGLFDAIVDPGMKLARWCAGCKSGVSSCNAGTIRRLSGARRLDLFVRL